MTQTKAGMSIGQVARRVGLSAHALRFYEREGLLVSPVERSSTGHRVYSEFDVEWLAICIKLRASGMPLPQIRRYAELVREGPGNETARLELMREHRDRVTAQMAELTKCLDLIKFKVDIYESHVAEGTAHTLWNGQPVAPSADRKG